MNPKSLLLIFGGMTLSFGLILAVMLAAVSSDPKPRRKTTRHRVVEQTTPPARTAKPPTNSTRGERPARRQKTQRATAPATAAAPPPTVASETLSAPAVAPAKPTPLQPNKVAMQQLGSLKNDLNRELRALKKDRDAMLVALAQSLVVLPPKEIAGELAPLDDPSAATVLRALTPQMRGKVLDHFDPKRAQRLKKRLK